MLQKTQKMKNLMNISETNPGDRYRLQLTSVNQAFKEKCPEWDDRHKLILLHDVRPLLQTRQKILERGELRNSAPITVFVRYYSFTSPVVLEYP